MIKHTRHILCYLCLTSLLLIPEILMAEFASHDTANQASFILARGGVSLKQATEKVKKDTGGRILTAETVDRDGKKVHRIKVLLPNGHVRVIFVDAE